MADRVSIKTMRGRVIVAMRVLAFLLMVPAAIVAGLLWGLDGAVPCLLAGAVLAETCPRVEVFDPELEPGSTP